MSHSPTNPLSDDVITGMLNQHEKESRWGYCRGCEGDAELSEDGFCGGCFDDVEEDRRCPETGELNSGGEAYYSLEEVTILAGQVCKAWSSGKDLATTSFEQDIHRLSLLLAYLADKEDERCE